MPNFNTLNIKYPQLLNGAAGREFQTKKTIVRGFEAMMSQRFKAAAMQFVWVSKYLDHFSGRFPFTETGSHRVYFPVIIKYHQVDLIGKKRYSFNCKSSVNNVLLPDSHVTMEYFSADFGRGCRCLRALL